MLNWMTIRFCVILIFLCNIVESLQCLDNICANFSSAENRTHATIVSWTICVDLQEDVTLPCLAARIPSPDVTWKINGVELITNDHIRQQPDGSLFIRNVNRGDAGEYTCDVENMYGRDSVTYQLFVNAPPYAPEISVFATTTNSITIRLTAIEADNEDIQGYTVHYQPPFEVWQEVQVPSTVDKYTLENLLCGARYQFYVTAYNSIGTSVPSNNLTLKTRGTKPISPTGNNFIEPSSRHVVLHLKSWSDNGCPLQFFVIEYKKKSSTEWKYASNNVKTNSIFSIGDLDPLNWYHLRVTAHNNAGFSVGEFEFVTLSVTGG